MEDQATRRSYRYNGPYDFYGKDADSELVEKGGVVEMTDREAVIALQLGNILTLLDEDEDVAERLMNTARGGTEPVVVEAESDEDDDDGDDDPEHENDDEFAEDESFIWK